MTFLQFISKFHREESGQDLVEYALVLVAVATGVVAGSPSTIAKATVVNCSTVKPALAAASTRLS